MPNLDPNARIQLQFSLPRWLHEKITKQAAEVGVSVKKLMALMIYEGSRDIDGLPKPPRGTPLPSIDDAVNAFASGAKLRGPCGANWEECKYDKAESRTLNEMEFCNDCGIRVH